MNPKLTRGAATGAALAVLVGALALGGCTRREATTPADRLQAAKAMLEASKANEAVIELKVLLQDEPNSAEARFLLGRAILSLGNPREAVVELRKAVELNSTNPEAIPLLARAMLEAHQHKALINEWGAAELPDDQAQATLRATLALAYSREGDAARANAAIDEAFAKAPHHPTVLLAKARILGGAGKAAEALTLVDEAAKLEPKSPEAWMLKADLLLLGVRDRAKAREAYRTVLTLQPANLVAHMTLFGLAAVDGDAQAMRAQQLAMAKVAPNHPQTLFAEAQLAAVEHDFKRAKELNDRTMKYFADNAMMLQFAGYVELNVGALVQAENYLGKAVQLAPRLRSARHMLATIYLRTNQPSKAIDVLKPALQGRRPDFVALALLAESHLHLGDAKTAELLFRQSAKVKPDDPQVRTSLALLRLGRGDVGAALEDLQAIAASSADTVADLALVSAQLRRGDHAAALTAIDGLQKKAPKSALPDLLRAKALIALKRRDDARKSLEAALAKDAQYLPAVAGLAAIDLAEQRPQDAERRFANVLKVNPKNYAAQLALAELRLRAGAPREEVVKLLDAVVKTNPNEGGARLALIRYLSTNGEAPAAMTAALAAVAALPENMDLATALGELQMRGGEHEQAVATLSKVAAKLQKSPVAYLKLGEAQLAAQDLAGAERSAKRALELAPKSMAAYRSLVAIYMLQSKPPLALQAAHEWQKLSPKDPSGYQWEGDIHAELKDHDAALKAYRRGLAAAPGGTLPERIYSLLDRAKGKEEAQRFAAEWRRQQPKDTGLTMFFGNTALVKRDYPAAAEHFTEVVRIRPDHGVALNNLAWVTAKLGRPGAVALAERALALAPENPSFKDTLAFALAAEKQYPRAIEVAKSVQARAPGDPNGRLGLAEVYAMAGQRTLALGEVAEIEKQLQRLRDKQRLQDIKATLK